MSYVLSDTWWNRGRAFEGFCVRAGAVTTHRVRAAGKCVTIGKCCLTCYGILHVKLWGATTLARSAPLRELSDWLAISRLPAQDHDRLEQCWTFVYGIHTDSRTAKCKVLV